MGRTYRSRKRNNLSSIDISPPVRDRVLENLCVWMTQNGWKPESQLRPYVFNYTGRGLQCLCALPVGHVIVSIPENIVITCKKVLASSLSKIFEDNTNPNYPTAQQILATFLVLERRLSTESKWSSYVSSIPSKFSTPLFQPKPLKFPQYLKEKINEEAERLTKSLDWVNSQLLINQIKQLTWHEYLWAWYAVNSRAVFVEPSAERICKDKDNMALAPFLDLLNHSPYIKPNQVGWNNGFYEIKASESFSRHSQVFISYGTHDNLTLCLEYGFVIPENPHDRVLISEEEIVLVLRQKFEFKNPSDIIWCTREGLNWSGLVFVAKCLGQTVKGDLSENKIILSCVQRIVSSKLKMLEDDFKNLKLEENPCESIQVMKDLISEHIKILHCTIGLSPRI